jgi:hypothetical protein
MPVQEGKALDKAACAKTEGQRTAGPHVKTAATEGPTAGQPDTKL